MKLTISTIDARPRYALARREKAAESDERLFTLAGWRDAPYFSEAERAALALTEAATRLSDRSDPVPDDLERGRQALRRAGASGPWWFASRRSTPGIV